MAELIERKIFMASNTPDGFVGYFDQIVDNYRLNKLYILKGGSGVGKSTFIQKFARALIAHYKGRRRLTVDYLMCSADPKSYDGAIIHELGIGIIDGTFPHITDPKYPGLVDEIIDLAQFIDSGKIKMTQAELYEMKKQRKDCFRRAYAELYRARELHEQVEAVYGGAVDFGKVDKVFSEIIKTHI